MKKLPVVAFALFLGLAATLIAPDTVSAQTWEDHVRGKQPAPVHVASPFSQLCSRIGVFYALMRPTGHTQKEAQPLARDLLGIFDQLVEERSKAKACYYMGRSRSLAFSNGPEVMNVVIDIMTRGRLVPKHLDKTPEELRRIVLKDLQQQVANARKEGGVAWVPKGPLVRALDLGMKSFGVTIQELGLNGDEEALVKMANR